MNGPLFSLRWVFTDTTYGPLNGLFAFCAEPGSALCGIGVDYVNPAAKLARVATYGMGLSPVDVSYASGVWDIELQLDLDSGAGDDYYVCYITINGALLGADWWVMAWKPTGATSPAMYGFHCLPNTGVGFPSAEAYNFTVTRWPNTAASLSLAAWYASTVDAYTDPIYFAPPAGSNVLRLPCGAELLYRLRGAYDADMSAPWWQVSFTRYDQATDAWGEAAELFWAGYDPPCGPLCQGRGLAFLRDAVAQLQYRSADSGHTWALDDWATHIDPDPTIGYGNGTWSAGVAQHWKQYGDSLFWARDANADYFELGDSLVASLLRPAHAAGCAPAPICFRGRDGRIRVGCFVGDAYREWTAADFTPDWGSTWTEGTPAQDWTAGAGELAAVRLWCGRGDVQAVAGYHWAEQRVQVLARVGVAGEWQGPAVVGASVDAVAPYLVERPDGRWECGWCDYAGTWTRYRANSPLGAWSSV